MNRERATHSSSSHDMMVQHFQPFKDFQEWVSVASYLHQKEFILKFSQTSADGQLTIESQYNFLNEESQMTCKQRQKDDTYPFMNVRSSTKKVNMEDNHMDDAPGYSLCQHLFMARELVDIIVRHKLTDLAMQFTFDQRSYDGQSILSSQLNLQKGTIQTNTRAAVHDPLCNDITVINVSPLVDNEEPQFSEVTHDIFIYHLGCMSRICDWLFSTGVTRRDPRIIFENPYPLVGKMCTSTIDFVSGSVQTTIQQLTEPPQFELRVLSITVHGDETDPDEEQTSLASDFAREHLKRDNVLVNQIMNKQITKKTKEAIFVDPNYKNDNSIISKFIFEKRSLKSHILWVNRRKEDEERKVFSLTFYEYNTTVGDEELKKNVDDDENDDKDYRYASNSTLESGSEPVQVEWHDENGQKPSDLGSCPILFFNKEFGTTSKSSSKTNLNILFEKEETRKENQKYDIHVERSNVDFEPLPERTISLPDMRFLEEEDNKEGDQQRETAMGDAERRTVKPKCSKSADSAMQHLRIYREFGKHWPPKNPLKTSEKDHIQEHAIRKCRRVGKLNREYTGEGTSSTRGDEVEQTSDESSYTTLDHGVEQCSDEDSLPAEDDDLINLMMGLKH